MGPMVRRSISAGPIGRRRWVGSRPCLHSAKLASCRPWHPQHPRSGPGSAARTRLAAGIGGATAGLSRRLGRGGGSVVGGRAILAVDPDALRRLAAGRRVALVSGTNGKTTTTSLLRAGLGHRRAGGHQRPWRQPAAGAGGRPGRRARPGAAAALEVDEAWLGGWWTPPRPGRWPCSTSAGTSSIATTRSASWRPPGVARSARRARPPPWWPTPMTRSSSGGRRRGPTCVG